MNDPFSVAAILGYLGAVSNMAWPFFGTRRAMLAAQTVGALLFAIHYALLGAFTACLLLAMAGVQALVAVPLGSNPRFRWMYLATLPVIGGIMASSWHGIASLFSALGMGTVSLARYQLDVIRFRALLVACVPFWMVHNYLVGSIPGLISDVVSVCAGIWMLRRALHERAAERKLPNSKDASA